MRLISFIKACICMHLTFVEFCKLSNIVQARRQEGGGGGAWGAIAPKRSAWKELVRLKNVNL